MYVCSHSPHDFMSLQSGLPGFYDPCVGEEKSLKVLYQFRGVMHQVLSGDTEPLRIPKQCKSLEVYTIATLKVVSLTFSYISIGFSRSYTYLNPA